MGKTFNKNYYREYIIFALVLCLCFLAASLLFLSHMMAESEKENVDYLLHDVHQKQIGIQKQVQGDIRTLESIAACVDNLRIKNAGQLICILKEIKGKSSFVRIGIADLNGDVKLFDMKGKPNKLINLYDRPFFQRALKGQSSVSRTIADPSEPNTYINYFAVPIRGKNSKIISILCAAYTDKMLLEILDTPIFKDAGFSNLVDEDGQFIVRSSRPEAQQMNAFTLGDMGTYTAQELAMIQNALKRQDTLEFYYNIDKEKQLAIIEPIGINGWSIISVAPESVLKQRYAQTVFGIGTIILAAVIIFLLLFYQQQRVLSKNQKALMELAYVDPLTGGRNRSKLVVDAEGFIRKNPRCVVWYCDFKNFKFFNDLFGYAQGDLVLKSFVRTVEKYGDADSSMFCHVSEDKFAGLRTYENEEELVAWFDTLAQSIQEEKIELADKVYIQLCMGFYCVSEGETATVNDMINRANMAHESVKNVPHSQCAFFTDEIRKKILQDTEMEAEGKIALQKGEFSLYFQPKINIQNGNHISGAEVLARWIHPKKGIIPPGDFIPLFEKKGLIVPLDRYIFEKACQWIADYLKSAPSKLAIAINVSQLGLLKPDFVDYYSSVKEEYGIPDGVLELEFTESVILGDDKTSRRIVCALHDRGFLCSIDDFGSGYSSLNMLKNLRADVLKLDIGFFRQDADMHRSRTVIANIVNMSKELQIITIAEGVEDVETVDFLRDIECDIVQGFAFAKPMPRDDFNQLLQDTEGQEFTPHDV